jgi:hypothetical protein
MLLFEAVELCRLPGAVAVIRAASLLCEREEFSEAAAESLSKQSLLVWCACFEYSP